MRSYHVISEIVTYIFEAKSEIVTYIFEVISEIVTYIFEVFGCVKLKDITQYHTYISKITSNTFQKNHAPSTTVD